VLLTGSIGATRLAAILVRIKYTRKPIPGAAAHLLVGAAVFWRDGLSVQTVRASARGPVTHAEEVEKHGRSFMLAVLVVRRSPAR
jgi:hypothetical protein